ncbi:MAG: hypothetical protein H6Q05_366 [Acidobacteria bacterium]|nr:hypothetical protein [Acidobacteriota bacterium]
MQLRFLFVEGMHVSEMQNAAQSTAPPSSDFRTTLVIVICATLLGASGGVLVASREVQLEPSEVLAKPAVKQSAAQAPAAENLPQNAETVTTEAREAPEPAASTSGTPSLPPTSLVGQIDCSHHQDGATVNIEVGTVAVARTEQLHNPERIFFDLRDSRSPDSHADNFLEMKTVRLDNPLVAGVRVSLWGSGTARVVLDLKRSCRYSYQLSPGPSPSLVVQVQEPARGTSDMKR